LGEGDEGVDWGKAEVLYGLALGIGVGWIRGCDGFFAPPTPFLQGSARDQPMESSSQDLLGAGSCTMESTRRTGWGQITPHGFTTAGINLLVGSEERCPRLSSFLQC
jgi:hypothetical protein